VHRHFPIQYGLRVKTAPTAEPLTLTEARAHSRFDSFAEDGVIAGFILAARTYIETLCGIALCPTTFLMTIDDFPNADYIELPREPLQSIVAVTYKNLTGGTTTWAASEYEVDLYSTPPRLRPKDEYDWPDDVKDQLAAVSIEFVAGYSGPEAIPQPIMQALRMLTAHYIENREAVLLNETPRELPFSVIPLLTQYRNPPV
jgi:uncharacterized phiE125 gp8 family phage protein